jgi:hypothetical protein
MPLTTYEREVNYRTQNIIHLHGSNYRVMRFIPLTPKQQRRVVKKTNHWSKRDQSVFVTN